MHKRGDAKYNRWQRNKSSYYWIDWNNEKSEKSKCGEDEIFKLVKDTIEENITREMFDKTLDSLIERDSVKCRLISNRKCLSVRKPNAIENLNLQGNFNNIKDETSFTEVKSLNISY